MPVTRHLTLCRRNLGADNNDPLGLAGGQGDVRSNPGPRDVTSHDHGGDFQYGKKSNHDSRLPQSARFNCGIASSAFELPLSAVAGRSTRFPSHRFRLMCPDSVTRITATKFDGAPLAPAASGTPTADGAPSRSTPATRGDFLAVAA